MNLYSDFAEEFSKTRQSPWLGWIKVLEEIKSKNKNIQKLKILDLGCGNGRFAKYLIENQIECEYTGVDKSQQLLGIAMQQIQKFKNLAQSVLKDNKGEVTKFIQTSQDSNFKFIQKDLEESDWSELPNGSYNIVVAFGVMHHISPFEKRRNFLQRAFGLTTENGILAVSYWQFGAIERYSNKKIHTDVNKNTNYCENDFILGFNNNAKRFCHFVNEEELNDLELSIKYKKLESFLNDGRENNENLYRLYFK